MDAWGIGVALQAMARNYFQMMRGQGRTAALLAELKDGDRVVFTNDREARRVQGLARDAGLKIECVTLRPNEAFMVERMRERGTPKGRLVLDHAWIEDYYASALLRATEDLDAFVDRFGGHGKPHIETRLKAVEHARWGL